MKRLLAMLLFIGAACMAAGCESDVPLYLSYRQGILEEEHEAAPASQSAGEALEEELELAVEWVLMSNRGNRFV